MRFVKKSTALLLVAAMALTWVPLGARAAEQESVIRINPIEGLSPDFIKGSDVSMLSQIKESGGRYHDGGVEKDALQILKDHGTNWVRLRIWNNPVDPDGNPLGGGNNDLARTVETAVYAKELGLKVLLDFHYSDFWADPGKQFKPAAWEGLSGAELEQAVYDYTDSVIRELKAQDAMPDMVQIGNETNGGMIWPDGKTWQQSAGEEIGGYDGFANLLKAGIRAVEDNDPEDQTRIMLHLADGGDNDLYRRVFDALTLRGVNFDIIGLSFYPYWHGTLEELKHNMNDISTRYDKDVIVVETAYAHTLENGDGFTNIFGPAEESAGGYKATVQGQAQAVRDIMNAVHEVPGGRGLGVFYWEQDWIPVEGAGWKTGEGNGWDNQAMFDFEGNALPSLDVYNLVSAPLEGEPYAAELEYVQPVTLDITVGGELQLPAAVKGEFSDDSIRLLPVDWEAVSPEDLTKPGTLRIAGTIEGASLQAEAVVTVEGTRNYVTNAGFEAGDFSGWTLSGDTEALDAEKSSAPAGNAYSGDYSLHYYLDRPYTFKVEQKVTGLPDGTYTAAVRTQGGGGEKSLKLFAVNAAGDKLTADIVNTAWHEWKHIVIPNITVTGGELTLGVEADANNGSWGSIDEFELYTDHSQVTLSAPEEVEPGSEFSVGVGVDGLVNVIGSQDLQLSYDRELFQYVGAESSEAGTVVAATYDADAGTVHLVTQHAEGKAANTESLQVKFKAQHIEREGTIGVTSAEWTALSSGKKITPSALGSVTVSVYGAANHEPGGGTGGSNGGGNGGDGNGGGTGGNHGGGNSGGTDGNHGGGTDGNTGGGTDNGSSNDDDDDNSGNGNGNNGSGNGNSSNGNAAGKPAYEAATGTATAKLSADEAAKRLKAEGGQVLKLEIPAVEGAKAYAQELPAALLQEQPDLRIELVTPFGSVSLPGSMLAGSKGLGSGPVTVSIRTVDPSELKDEALKGKLGGKPVIDLTVLANGQPVAWNNPDAPVTVSIPYKPNAAEAQHPEYLTVWYLNANGEAEAVPTSHWNAKTGLLTFQTTHFSAYAAAYDKRSFSDLSHVGWAAQAVEALAAKGVIQGTSDTEFAPDAPVTRAEFLQMLVRAAGLTASFDSNFSDVARTDYFYDAAGIAKKLGVAGGRENGVFAPSERITREDLMVLTVRALEKAGRWKNTGGSGLEAFSDASTVAGYAADAAASLVQAGVINGRGGVLAPKEATTRAEAAVILYRALQVSEQ
ncbi:glycosyl hydrolase 53 family protein [Paenibacillus caseinilyticus]|uniref:Arabinogalactan endo-beta-1,4-galactanase n=1 Tax=Paenibacillus mucilaginosus K02 TaxID=997761 RepID=I0BGN8_9BACL|nr:glycosyl hydrolase 53 family protein [Paenibacillus mucilaginosus]AFH61535.1 arabinogalactan endo-1,4-beta-galactosidase [Paenibacillus mucilaginosus K02]AFK65332.1 arabinogalactan endo-1,4-beta-galactosidase [Paenibacillus mucilaginosus K02]